MKPVINVVFREVKHGKFKGEVDCVFIDPDTFEKDFKMSCYAKIGQHSMGCASYFYHSTKPAKDYTDLLKEVEGIYSDYRVVVHNKLPKYESVLKAMRGL